MLQVWFSNRRARLRKQMSYTSAGGSSAPAGTNHPLPLAYGSGGGSMSAVSAVVTGSTPYTNLSACGSMGESAHLYSTPSMYSTPLSPSLPSSAIHPSSYGSSSMLVAANTQVIDYSCLILELEL